MLESTLQLCTSLIRLSRIVTSDTIVLLKVRVPIKEAEEEVLFGEVGQSAWEGLVSMLGETGQRTCVKGRREKRTSRGEKHNSFISKMCCSVPGAGGAPEPVARASCSCR